MFGLGLQEIIILAILGVLLIAGPIIVLIFVLRKSSAPRDRDLEQENRRLQRENDRLREGK